MTLKSILNETEPDFSAKIIPSLSLSDLDQEAIDNFKYRWAQKASREDYGAFSNEKISRSIGILSDTGLNYASLILFGKKEKIDSLIPANEIIFEWRHEAKKVPHDFRMIWREPFFKIYEEVWKVINARNLAKHI